MREQLIIFLHSLNLTQSVWVTATADGLLSRPVVCAHDSLAAAQENREIIVVVPAEDVLLLSVNLPGMPRSRLLQALPFAVEEQLIADLDTQHIVPAAIPAEGSMIAAVVAHVKMQLWLDQLTSWGVQADHMLPVSSLLPQAEQAWEMMASQTDIISDEMLSDVARNTAKLPAFNLLQGQYAVKKSRLRHTKKISQVTAALGVVFVGLLLSYPIFSYMILKSRASTINSQIAAIYHREFPNAASVVAPKRRMEEKLHQVTSQLDSNKFLLLMGYVGKSMQSAPSLHLKRLQYQGSRLSLEVSANSAADFSAFTRYLQEQGLKVKQENANVTGDRVTAIVDVE